MHHHFKETKHPLPPFPHQLLLSWNLPSTGHFVVYPWVVLYQAFKTLSKKLRRLIFYTSEALVCIRDCGEAHKFQSCVFTYLDAVWAIAQLQTTMVYLFNSTINMWCVKLSIHWHTHIWQLVCNRYQFQYSIQNCFLI